MAGDLKRLSGLWLKSGKSGKYMTGKLDNKTVEEIDGPVRLLVFRNDRKKAGSNDPDYTLFAAPVDGDRQQSDPVTQEESAGESIPF